MVEGAGFEPAKLARQIYSLIPLATREPLRRERAILLAAPTLVNQNRLLSEGHRRRMEWSWREESNPRPADYKSAALPAELRQQHTRQAAPP